MATLSFEQFVKQAGGKPQDVKVVGSSVIKKEPEITQSSDNFISRVGSDLSKRAKNVAESFRKEVTSTPSENTPIGGVRLGLRVAGQTAGAVTDVLGETVKSIADTTGATALLKPVGIAVLETDIGKQGLQAIKSGMDAYSKFKVTHPDTANALEDVLNIATLLPVGAGSKVVGQGVVDVTKGATKIAGEGFDIASKMAQPSIETLGNLAKGVKDVSMMSAEGISRIPSRIATNVAEKQMIKEEVSKLPTQIAKKAVQDGVDIKDINYIYKIPKNQKSEFKTLLKSVQDFEKGISNTNPIEIVGKPIVKRIKELENTREIIGKQLGTVADTLGNVTTKEVYPSIFNNLKKVPGLNGLKVDKKGILDFTDTVLATAETSGDRKAIQSIFTNAIKNGTGKQKHLLRQELFESLGGKKKSLTQLTGTQERAYEAIRKGLSDVLDTKNTKYKDLNTKYAKVANPLSEMRKLMKSTGATEDILDMKAGLLARRLTSNSASNPQIRSILKSMDNATAKKGVSQISVENLQDFYNLLDKYYDIAGKTSLQGQITSGMEKIGSLTELVTKTVGELAGKTSAVKRKALEDALLEALK